MRRERLAKFGLLLASILAVGGCSLLVGEGLTGGDVRAANDDAALGDGSFTGVATGSEDAAAVGDATALGPPPDASTGPDPDAGSRDSGGAPQKLAFVTKTAVSPTADMVGLANAQCASDGINLAGAAGRTFVAWLSTGSSGLDPGVAAIAALNSDGPWYLPTGERVAASAQALIAGTIEHAIDRHADGTALLLAPRVWTGTHADGTAHVLTCSSWKDNTGAGLGLTGNTSAKDGRWTSDGALACDKVAPVYCFEK